MNATMMEAIKQEGAEVAEGNVAAVKLAQKQRRKARGVTPDKLKGEARENALETMRRRNEEAPYPWFEATLEGWKDDLEEKGFNDAEIEFNTDYGCYHVSVEGYIDCGEKLKARIPKELFDCIRMQALIFRMMGDGFTGHGPDSDTGMEGLEWHGDKFRAGSRNTEVDLTLVWMGTENEEIEAEVERFNEGLRADLNQELTSICGEVAKSLEAEWEYLNSEECLLETAEANDWRFDEDGDFCG